MLIKTVPASWGVRWLTDGARLFRRQPLGLPAMVGAYLTVLLLPALIPLVGLALAGVLGPFASVGLMQCVREVAVGRPPTLAQFTQPFRDPRARVNLFRLGLVNAGLLMLVAILTTLLAPDMPETAQPPSIEDIPLQTWLVQMLFYAPVMGLMWFAPLLAGWHGMTPAKAMFGSFVACWRNLLPLLVFGAAALALSIAAGMVAVAVLGALLSKQAAMLVLTPIVLVLMTIVQSSFFPMYLSVFSEMPRPLQEAGAPSPETDDDAH